MPRPALRLPGSNSPFIGGGHTPGRSAALHRSRRAARSRSPSRNSQAPVPAARFGAHTDVAHACPVDRHLGARRGCLRRRVTRAGPAHAAGWVAATSPSLETWKVTVVLGTVLAGSPVPLHPRGLCSRWNGRSSRWVPSAAATRAGLRARGWAGHRGLPWKHQDCSQYETCLIQPRGGL